MLAIYNKLIIFLPVALAVQIKINSNICNCPFRSQAYLAIRPSLLGSAHSRPSSHIRAQTEGKKISRLRPSKNRFCGSNIFTPFNSNNPKMPADEIKFRHYTFLAFMKNYEFIV